MRSDTEAWRRRVVAAITAAATAAGCAPAASAQLARDARVQRDLRALVAAPGGPPGAIVTLYRKGRTTVLRAGVSKVGTRRSPRATDHMRIASIAKAFSAAIVLQLADQRRLRLGDTLGRRDPGLPRAWARVTIRQLLNHTSGLPDYTESDGFRQQVDTDPTGYVAPRTVISWVAHDSLLFTPGSRYRYSNTDNIVAGLIAERVTHRSYANLLRTRIVGPLKLRQTSFPMRVALPRPYLHGYAVSPGAAPRDVSEALSPSGAWASGAIVSTPRDLGSFIRGYIGGKLFSRGARRQQFRFVAGAGSSPPGPGANAAGLGVFSYRSRCGTVYGHTGNFPGYVQWAAATADGRRSVTTTLNIAAPTGRLLAKLRGMQADAVCALLR
jgi:D-alanyl-D-alanine carboxypeptidase